jgi:hypothetical protein
MTKLGSLPSISSHSTVDPAPEDARAAWGDTDRITYRGVAVKQHARPARWRVGMGMATRCLIRRVRVAVVRADSAREATVTPHPHP